jgi:hypothetical protein
MSARLCSARALCEALSAAAVTLDAPDGTRLVARPRTAVTEDLTARLKRFKPELIGAIWRGVRAHLGREIAPCQGCDAEFVHVSERYCPWCKVTEVGREFISTVHLLDTMPADRHQPTMSPRVPKGPKSTPEHTWGHPRHL